MEDLRMFLLPHARHDVLHEAENGMADKAMSIITAFLEHCAKIYE